MEIVNDASHGGYVVSKKTINDNQEEPPSRRSPEAVKQTISVTSS
jgi:hypothetical protein